MDETGEKDAVVRAVVDQLLVDEFAAIVAIHPSKREREERADSLDALDHEGRLTFDQRDALRPAGGNISEYQGVDEAAGQGLTGMRN